MDNLNAWEFTFDILSEKIIDYETILKNQHYDKFDNDKAHF